MYVLNAEHLSLGYVIMLKLTIDDMFCSCLIMFLHSVICLDDISASMKIINDDTNNHVYYDKSSD